MVQKLRFLFFLLLVVQFAVAQSPYLHWAASDGGGGFDIGRAVALDAQGNSYVVGMFQTTADFDPGSAVMSLVSAGDNDVFVQKLDAAGHLVWAKRIGGTAVDEGKGVAVDPVNGDIYVTGRYSGTVDFDPGAGTSNATAIGQADAFVLKLDANGNFLWAKQMGATGSDEGTALYADASGVATIGYFQGTMDLNPGTGVFSVTSASGTLDMFVQRLDANGNFVWGNRWGDTGMEYGFGIADAGNGKVIATGCFQETVDFDPGLGTTQLVANPGVTSAYVLQLDAAGNLGWVRQIGTAGYTIGYAARVSASGSVYVTGGVNGMVDFDPGPGANNHSSTSYDAFLYKLQPDGDYVNAWAWGGIGDDYGYAIDLSSDAVYLTGGYGATVDFDPSPIDSAVVTSFNSTFDGFVEKFDTAGNYQWVVSNGGAGIDYGFGLAVDGTGHVLSTGCYDFLVDFEPGPSTYNLQTSGYAEIYVQMLKQCTPSAGSVTLNGCDSLVVNNQTFTTSGTFTQTLTNQSGCDSVLTLQLTIGQGTGSTLADTACLAYELNGITYDSSGTYFQTLTNVAGCDSVIELQLVVHDVDTIVNSGSGLIANTANGQFQWLDCGQGFQAIPGATNAQFLPSVTGNYAVAVTQNGCTDTSGCHFVLVIGVENASNVPIRLHPNPNAGRFRLEMEGVAGLAVVEIHDILGQLARRTEVLDGGEVTFEGMQGIYFVTVSNETRIWRLKILKN